MEFDFKFNPNYSYEKVSTFNLNLLEQSIKTTKGWSIFFLVGIYSFFNSQVNWVQTKKGALCSFSVF
jgi:hypothetical protein